MKHVFAFLFVCTTALSFHPSLHAQGFGMRLLGRYSTGIYNAGGAEITAYDAQNRTLYLVNAEAAQVLVLDMANIALPRLQTRIDLTAFGTGVNSITVRNGIAAIAVERRLPGSAPADNAQDSGRVVFINAQGATLASVTVGALPDMVTFSPDGRFVLVANEGEPSQNYQNDPEGSVSVISIPADIRTITQANVRFARFNDFNVGGSRRAELRDSSLLHLPSPSTIATTLAQNLEPEYVTISSDSQTAYVTLQEANALAIVDIPTARVTAIRSLGFKNHNLSGNGFDASDNGTVISITPRPTLGMYQPDAITSLTRNNETFLLTANEGDTREYTAYSEVARVSTLRLDSTKFQNVTTLTLATNLGRLNVTNARGDNNRDGLYDSLFSIGARSFSVWSADGTLVWDSGDQLEQIINTLLPANFNANHTANTPKNRIDDKGPEPEGIVVGQVGDSVYAFIGLERISGVIVYNVTNPRQPRYVMYYNPRAFSVTPGAGTLNTVGDLGPEGLEFIPSAQSPTGRPMLIVAYEISGTVSIYDLDPRTTSRRPLSSGGMRLTSLGNNQFQCLAAEQSNGIQSAPLEMMIADIQGRIIQHNSFTGTDALNRFIIDLQTQPSGMYFMRILQGTNMYESSLSVVR